MSKPHMIRNNFPYPKKNGDTDADSWES